MHVVVDQTWNEGAVDADVLTEQVEQLQASNQQLSEQVNHIEQLRAECTDVVVAG